MVRVVDHHIQRTVLRQVSLHGPQRFGQLKPKEIDSNAFTYHLKQLIGLKYLEKSADTYILTPAGMTYITLLSALNDKPRLQPKIVTIFALQNTQREYLMAQRKQEPSRGTYMLPSGKQHFEESPEEQVVREAKEQFGTTVDVKHAGMMDLRIRYSDVLVTHLIAHVMKGQTSLVLPAENDRFSYIWAPSSSLGEDELTPGTRELMDALENHHDLFYLSLDVNSEWPYNKQR